MAAQLPAASAAESSKIRISALQKEFNTRDGSVVTALDGIDLQVPSGQFCVIVGPSGCGKTTLLRILAGLEKPTAGRVEVEREDPRRPLNAMVFQEQSVFPWLTVRRNVGYGLEMRNVPRRQRREIVDQYLAMVGLTRFAEAYPHQLSGGMKQRVSIARAFANDPEILLMDEPFASLDEQTKALLQEELLKIWEATRKTVLFITHSIDEAVLLGDRVQVMTARPGQMKADIAVDFPRPRDDIYRMKADPRFGELVYHVWTLLRDEVLRAKREGA